jgi:hypothetical protein
VAQFRCEFDHRSLPAEVGERGKALLLDQLGCELLGSTLESNSPVYRFVRENKNGGGPAIIVNHGDGYLVKLRFIRKWSRWKRFFRRRLTCLPRKTARTFPTIRNSGTKSFNSGEIPPPVASAMTKSVRATSALLGLVLDNGFESELCQCALAGGRWK